jgi:spore maturation protein CgeB
MRTAGEWREALAGLAPRDDIRLEQGRGGQPTLVLAGAYLHSPYNPAQEAARLIESAALDATRPVAVLGLGLGYHVRALVERGFKVAVFEPDRGVAAAALAAGILDEACPLALGDPEDWREDKAVAAFAKLMPQVLVHPPTARAHPAFAEAATAALAVASLRGQRLNIAVVGPLYGGSLPITGYLVRALRGLGHNAVEIANDLAWPLYEKMTGSVDDAHASNQLGNLLTNAVSEWTYARVAEFQPEICIVMAQSPVHPNFPARLAKHGIITAFWYVENWRHLSYWRDIAPRYDYFFHIQPGAFEQQLDEAGCAHHAFVQTGCDPDLHAPATLNEEDAAHFGCDLSFAGAGYYNRLQFFKGLTDYHFKIWGVDWPDRAFDKLLVDGEQRFDHTTFMKIVAASKINLNLHSSAQHDGVDPKCDALNPRVFEIAAAGGFQLCDPCQGLDTHFAEDEVPTYRSLPELRAKIDHYLAYPEERAAIARRARKRALAEHTYAHRAQQMLDLIFAAHGTRILKHGIRAQHSLGDIAERLGAESPLGQWLAELPRDVVFTEEGISAFLGPLRADMPFPEKLFRYMHEVRTSADALLKAPR